MSVDVWLPYRVPSKNQFKADYGTTLQHGRWVPTRWYFVKGQEHAVARALRDMRWDPCPDLLRARERRRVSAVQYLARGMKRYDPLNFSTGLNLAVVDHLVRVGLLRGDREDDIQVGVFDQIRPDPPLSAPWLLVRLTGLLPDSGPTGGRVLSEDWPPRPPDVLTR